MYGHLVELSKQAKKLKFHNEVLDDFRLQLNAAIGLPEDKSAKMLPSAVGTNLTGSSTRDSVSSIQNESRPSAVEGKPVVPQPSPLKLFAKLPKQITESSLEKPELMRLSAVYELIETEIDYVKDLQTMLNFHKPQLQQVLSEQDCNSIFSNIEQLLNANQVNFYDSFQGSCKQNDGP